MRVIGIESSCDETGVAIYDSEKGLLANVLYSQVELHAEYGGVVPELASRDHIQKALSLIKQALSEADLATTVIDGIAYTRGPGLVGSLLVGAVLAKSIGWALKIPTLGIHHLESHLLAPMLEEEAPSYPFVALLVSGGHTALIRVEGLGAYQVLGETLDDAVGEAFDKVAKLLGLSYPGGAALAKLAEKGTPNRYHFPRPMLDRPGLNFSFSGLKTAVSTLIASMKLTEEMRADIAHAFQEAVVETLLVKTWRAMQETNLKNLVVAGGVGANTHLREELQRKMSSEGGRVFYPRPEFCTDNAAMVAYTGCQRMLLGQSDADLSIHVQPRWSLNRL